jgi:ubiquinone/menaquinone biosynthesis C-methylase UbiE
MPAVTSEQVRAFWDRNPLCAQSIPHPLGSRAYFEHFDRLREAIDSPVEATQIHEFAAFAGKRVLDVGSGNGYVLSHYARHSAEVHGIDITPTAVKLCRQRFAIAGLTGTFHEADAEHLPFADDFFDCACSMGVLHHVPNPPGAIAEIYRVLKPGGRLIVMFYHKNSALFGINFRLRQLLTGKSRPQLVNEYDGAGNPKGEVYTKAELAHLLRQFTDLEMRVRFLEGFMVAPKVGRLLPRVLLKPLEPFWGFNLYAKAFKPGERGL